MKGVTEMHIGGLQKTTLLDYPGKVACTVFLPGCNLRCPFCHNAGLVLPQRISGEFMEESQVFSFLERRKGKLDGVCVTGGEPTVHPDLPEFLEKIRAMGFLVKLDTNGSHPQMLRQLLEAGTLSYVAMDIKNSPEKYRETCGGTDILPQVEQSAALLMENRIPFEFRTTVCSLHTPEDLRRIGTWLQGPEDYFLQPFRDSADLVGQGITGLLEDDITALRRAVLPWLPNTRIRGL